jgi:hypothetical protein
MNLTSWKRPSGSSRGAAMIAALALLSVAAAIMLLMFLRTMDELRHGRDDTAIVQTLLAAQGGANLGQAAFQTDIRDALDQIDSLRSSTVSSWSFGDSAFDADAPTVASVASDLGIVAGELQDVIDDLLCDDVDLGGSVSLTVRIFVTASACGDPLPPGISIGDGRFVSGARREDGGNQRYALPFVIVSQGEMGEFRRRVVTHGEAQFVVGRRSFARYAFFTDFHSFGGAGRIWFNERTLFDGPVHTNGHFNFASTPWFGAAVSSAGVTGSPARPGAYGIGNSGDQFFDAAQLLPPNQANAQLPVMDVGTRQNRPIFAEAAPDWRASRIELPTNAFDQWSLAQPDGLFFPNALHRLQLFAADAAGSPVSGSTAATYQYIVATEETETTPWTTSTYRLDADGVLKRRQVGAGGVVSWVTVTTSFNGVLYADRYVHRLEGGGRTTASDPATARPALASFAQMTIVPSVGGRITGDLTYETPPCVGTLEWVTIDGVRQVSRPTCDELDARNVLGIFAPTGNILIGHENGSASLNAPTNVQIQGSLMASSGVVMVERYGSGNSKGSVGLLGGIIEREYGPFGTFSGANPVSGYGLRFTFDPRLGRGLAPPYFPTVTQDGVTDVQLNTFGTRERIY